MKIKAGQEEIYAEGKEKNADPYGSAGYRFLEKWADLMEAEILAGCSINDVAKKCSHEADTDGITGFMYGCAVGVLSQCWEYGEELRQWHNLDTQIGDEGERANAKGTVLNPALLNINSKQP